LIKSQVLYRLS